MYLKSKLLYLYTETPLHAGAGAGLGAIDLPIQRERVTHYPIVQASGIKGAIRSHAVPVGADDNLKREGDVVFGPENPATGDDHAGAFAPGDARILLFPVRSLTGVFAWTTSLDVLRRWQREATAVAGPNLPALPDKEPDDGRCFVPDTRGVVAQDTVVLEEFAYTVDNSPMQMVKDLAKWLANHALPQGDEYSWWRDGLQKKLVILPDDDFRDFARYATEVLTRIRLEQETKTVKDGALWTEEHLPVDTLLFVPVRATRFRAGEDEWRKVNGWQKLDGAEAQAAAVLQWVEDRVNGRIQIGGDETVGRGVVALRW